MQEKHSVLITGGSGYIGTAVTKKLLDDGHHVIVYCNLSSGHRNLVDSRAVFVEGDILDGARLDYILKVHECDTVIHLAARKSVGESELNPYEYYQTNVVGTLTVLEQMYRNDVTKLIFSSTASVYSSEDELHYHKEDDKILPVSIYGSTKFVAEEIIKQYHRSGFLDEFLIFRYFNVAGDAGLGFTDFQGQNIFPKLMSAYINQVSFEIFGDNYPTSDGTALRDYVHLIDLVRAHQLAIKSCCNGGGVYNLGSGKGYTVKEVVDEFLTQLDNNLEYRMAKRRPGDAGANCASIFKAERDLGWSPQFGLSDMVSSTISAYSNML